MFASYLAEVLIQNNIQNIDINLEEANTLTKEITPATPKEVAEELKLNSNSNSKHQDVT